MDSEVKRKVWRQIKNEAPELAQQLTDIGTAFGIGFLHVRFADDSRVEIGNRTPIRMKWDGKIRPIIRRYEKN